MIKRVLGQINKSHCEALFKTFWILKKENGSQCQNTFSFVKFVVRLEKRQTDKQTLKCNLQLQKL